MDLKELTYLITIAQERSISKAAERLFMAQSSLSQSLQSMEAELGGKLFIRTSSGVRLTQAGELMVERAGHMLSEYRQVQDMIRDMEGLKAGRVDFGVSTFRGSHLLPPALYTFKQRYPAVQVEIHEANSMALEQLLMDGKLDLGLVALPLTKLKAPVRVLARDEIVIVAAKSHPVCQAAKETLRGGSPAAYLDLEDTMEYEYILSDYDTMLGYLGRKEFSGRGLVPKVSSASLTAPFAAAMARAGLGLAFTYRSCMDQPDRSRYYSIGKDGVFLTLALAYPPGRYRSKAALALERHLAGSMEEIAAF